jgi:proteasome lid subunit RPN8/RPN11
LAFTNNSLNALILPGPLRQQMLEHALTRLPEEACGLLGGRREDLNSPFTAAAVLPIENELHSPVRFRMAPAEQLKAFYWLEENGLELTAIFHSHPQGPDHPSATDLAEFAYPGVLMLILSPISPASLPDGSIPLAKTANGAQKRAISTDEWQIRAFRIDGGLPPQLTASELPLLGAAGPRSAQRREG